jgi:GTPase SAR1 family protein
VGVTETVLTELGLEVIKRTSPGPITYLATWARGKRILIIGPSKSGKTAFRDYLRYGIFRPETRHETTQEEKHNSVFRVKMGRDESLELVVRRATEIPGQVHAHDQAVIAFRRKPDALVIVMDVSTPLGEDELHHSDAWLSAFCTVYERRWLKSRVENNLKSLIIAMNKMDKVTPDHMEQHHTRYREIIRHLQHSRGETMEPILLMQSIAVENPRNTYYLDQIITELARTLGG